MNTAYDKWFSYSLLWIPNDLSSYIVILFWHPFVHHIVSTLNNTMHGQENAGPVIEMETRPSDEHTHTSPVTLWGPLTMSLVQGRKHSWPPLSHYVIFHWQSAFESFAAAAASATNNKSSLTVNQNTFIRRNASLRGAWPTKKAARG